MTSPSLPAGSPTAQLSGAIGVARVLCILGVVYVHAWTGLPGWALANSDHTFQGALRWTLMEFLGRSAVPLLGMISGWLVAGSASARPYRQFVAGKIRTILLPMAAWNAIAILLVSSASFAGMLAAPRPPLSPDAFGWFANELFSLTRVNHINVQMPFLRDLFVCMLAAPFLLRLPSVWLIAVAAAAAVWAISGDVFYVLLRPAILVFFVSGMLIRRTGLETRVAALPLWLAFAPFLAVGLLRVLLAVATDFNHEQPQLRVALDLVLRFVAALAFWRIAWALAGSRAAPALLRVEPFMFLMFCCHLILIWFGGPATGSLTGPLGSPLYPAFLILHPVLLLGASVVIGLALTRLSPAAARFLSGGRLKRPPRMAPAPPAEIRGQGAL